MVTPTVNPALLQPQWFLPLFCCLWLFISALLSILGGWFSLSREFLADGILEGQRFALRSGSLGFWPFPSVAYGNCLFITVNDYGFRLSILFLFRFLTPPLFIPWASVYSAESRSFLFMRYTLIRLNRGWPVICIRGSAGEYLADTHARVNGTP